jgi:hypothetical protein
MTNLLLFAEFLLCWQLSNYAILSAPARGEAMRGRGRARRMSEPAWIGWVSARSLTGALLMAAMGAFAWTGCILAGVVLAGSFALPLARRRIVPLTSLAEFEIGANGAVVFAGWLICTLRPSLEPILWLPRLSASQLATLCIGLALFIYVTRGGSLFVRGILEKAGGLPRSGECEPAAAGGFRHGDMIGQIERLIVVLVVLTGSYETLAFFFAAKGLIRSRELEDRALADYFLLGSLSSFLLALVVGMIMHKAIVEFWK